MIAFHNTSVTKPALLKQLRAHAKADQIVKGQYWQDGKGCAVGCSLESIRIIRGMKDINHASHAVAAKETGIPLMLWRLSDCIFEGLQNAQAQTWPIRFVESVAVGADLSPVGWKFLYWLLTDSKVNSGINHPLAKDAVKRCADVLLPLTRGHPVNRSAESAARSAWSAAESAWSAAESAAARAAESAARSAESAARSAESADSAAWSAAMSAAASTAWSAERSAAYVRMSKKLLSLIKNAPKAKRKS